MGGRTIGFARLLRSVGLVFRVLRVFFVIIAIDVLLIVIDIAISGTKRRLSRNTLFRDPSALAAHKARGSTCLEREFADFKAMKAGCHVGLHSKLSIELKSRFGARFIRTSSTVYSPSYR